ncbi:MAG: hypothetical protein ACN6RK_10955 [Stenotrophomonas sp.]
MSFSFISNEMVLKKSHRLLKIMFILYSLIIRVPFRLHSNLSGKKKRAWKTQARWRRKNSGKTGIALLLA